MQGDNINIDGKILRESKEAETETIQMVRMWANKQKLVLGQPQVTKKVCTQRYKNIFCIMQTHMKNGGICSVEDEFRENEFN